MFDTVMKTDTPDWKLVRLPVRAAIDLFIRVEHCIGRAFIGLLTHLCWKGHYLRSLQMLSCALRDIKMTCEMPQPFAVGTCR